VAKTFSHSSYHLTTITLCCTYEHAGYGSWTVGLFIREVCINSTIEEWGVPMRRLYRQTAANRKPRVFGQYGYNTSATPPGEDATSQNSVVLGSQIRRLYYVGLLTACAALNNGV